MSSVRAVDFRVQPPWTWSSSEPEPVRTDNMGYKAVYGADYKSGASFETLLEEMQRHDVKGVVHSEPTSGSASAWNERTAEVIRRGQGRFLAGFCNADPRDIMAGVREIARAHSELGLRGLSLLPDFYNIDLADKRCLPLISKAAELKMPVALHVGVNFTRHSPIRHGHPSFVDEIACLFPELVIICCHGGWPWVTEMIAVAWKHANVYLEFGAVAPRYLASPDSGWQPMRQFMNTQLQDRILFGSDWPMLHYDRMFEELPRLELKDSVLEKYLRANALSLLDRIMD